jgi:polysaccharide pyruvyl transferase WcaK-like protein
MWCERLRKIGANVVMWEPDKCTLDQFVEQLSSYGLFLTARYHGAVMAMLLGRPVVCICIEQKLQLIARMLQQGAQQWGFPFNVCRCMEMISDLEGRYDDAVRVIDSIVQRECAIGRQMAKELLDTLAHSVHRDDRGMKQSSLEVPE